MDSKKYELNDYVSLDEFENEELKKKLEKEGLEMYFNKSNNLYLVKYNLKKIKQMLLADKKIDPIDYERYKKEIDDFLQQNNKQIVSHLSDPVHNTIDFYSAENIQNLYGKTEIHLVDYNSLTTDQQKQYERNPFDDTYLYKNSEYYKNYTKLKLYKLINKGLSDDAKKLLDEDTNVLNTLNSRFSLEYETGNSLLYIAADKVLTSLVQKMLEKGADPNVKNNEGNTPLHVAVQNEMTTTVKILLEYDADPNVQNKEGNTPLQVAVQKGMTITVENLLKYDAHPNVQNKKGNTPLHVAVQQGMTTTVKNLLKYGAYTNVQNNEGNTPLHIAAQKGMTTTVENLLEKGANRGIINNAHLTPVKYSDNETIKRMLRGGSIKKKGRVNILNVNNNIMAKSRKNVSRRKNQKMLKRRNSRKNFRKMSGGVDCKQYPKGSDAYNCCTDGGDWQGNRCD